METLRTEMIEDAAKRDRRRRRILSPERIEVRVSEYRVSGLTRAAVARREGLTYSTCAGWVNARRCRAIIGRECVEICTVATAEGADGRGGVERVTAGWRGRARQRGRALAALLRALQGEPC